MSTHPKRAIAALIVTMFIWGTSAVFMRTTALTLAPENALALRFVLLVAMIAPALILTGHWRVARSDWPRLMLAAAGSFGSFWFTIQGFGRVAAGLGTVITMVEPILIALLAFVVLREPLSARLWLGLAVALSGGVVLFWPDLTAATTHPVDPVGVLYLLAAPTCFAIYTIAAKPLLTRYSAFAIMGLTTLLCAPPAFAAATTSWAVLFATTSAQTWAELVYLAAFNSLLGVVLWNYGTRHLPASVAGSTLYLLPVVAVVAGYLVLGEPITIWLMAGGMIVLAGVAVAQKA
jgi:drug/metabolite transporter (DMT)-like permease